METIRSGASWAALRMRLIAHRHLDECIVEAAPAAPVGRLLGREHVDRTPLTTGIGETSERHPGGAWPYALGHDAVTEQLTVTAMDRHHVTARQTALARVVGMDLDEQLAGTAAMPFHVVVSRIEIVQLFSGNQLQ